MSSRAEFDELGFRLKLYIALAALGGIVGAGLFTLHMVDWQISALDFISFARFVFMSFDLLYFWIAAGAGAVLGLLIAWRLTRAND